MKREPTRKWRLFWYGLLIACTFHAPVILVYAFCITGLGGWVIAGVEFLFLACLMMIGLLALGSILTILLFGNSPVRLALLCGSALYVVTLVPAVLFAKELRMVGFYLAAGRASPIVEAVRRYESDRGGLPADLDALMPTYLDQLPARLPPLRLKSGDGVERDYDGNRWVLEADTSTGVFNWDTWTYLPDQNFPEGGPYERVRDWVYYHE